MIRKWLEALILVAAFCAGQAAVEANDAVQTQYIN